MARVRTLRATARQGRGWGRRLAVGAASVILVAVTLGALVLEGQPRVAALDAPRAQTAVLTRDLAGRLQDIVAREEMAGQFTFSQAEADAALASAGRLSEGLAAQVRLAPGRAVVMASLGAPRMPRGLWLNLTATVAASETGFVLEGLRIGHVPVPPEVALFGARLVLDRALGPGAGRMAQGVVTGLRIDPPEVTLGYGFAPGTRSALLARIGAPAGGAVRAQVRGHLDWLHDGVADGYLEEAGSVVPRVRGVLERVAAEDGGPEALQAGLNALALYCGSPSLKLAIGTGLPPRMEGNRNRCRQRVTLGERDDLKRHFLLSAALEAATTGAATTGIGEMKELLDSRDGGTGFSFDDMAANRAGARLAAAFLAAPQANWPEMVGRIRTERDVLPEVGDLPSAMTEADFIARFGDVDSASYGAMIAEIDRRIERLPFHRALAAP